MRRARAGLQEEGAPRQVIMLAAHLLFFEQTVPYEAVARSGVAQEAWAAWE